MSRTPKAPRVGLRGRVAGWFKSFSGILASLATIVAAVAAVIAGHQTTVIRQQSSVIVNLHQQIASAKASAGVSPAPSTGASGGVIPPPGGLLSALQTTVRNAFIQDGPQTMSAKAYPNSVTFTCAGPQSSDQPEDEAYDVAGNTQFSAVIGIPDNATDATDLAETVIFANQNGTQLGKPVVVSLGSPATVQLNITGVTQLQITCTGMDQRNHQQEDGNQLTLGNAVIS